MGQSVCLSLISSHFTKMTLEQILAMTVLVHNVEKMALSYTVVTIIQDHIVAKAT
jgi:hypothetical protein